VTLPAARYQSRAPVPRLDDGDRATTAIIEAAAAPSSAKPGSWSEFEACLRGDRRSHGRHTMTSVTTSIDSDAPYLGYELKPGIRSAIERSAAEFEATGQWVTLEVLTFEAAERNEDFRLSTFDLPQTFVSLGTREELCLTALGLVTAGTAPRTAEALATMAKICAERVMRLRSKATISKQILREEYELDEFALQRALELFQLLPGASGGGNLGDEWSLSIWRNALVYRNVTGVADLLTVLRAQAVERLQMPRASMASTSPWNQPEELIRAREIRAPDRDPRAVFVVHGRDAAARIALWSFLEDLGLHPLEWNEGVVATGHATPFTGQVLEAAFQLAQAVVVLMTPDDEARLHTDLHGEHEPDYERHLTCQARPNVLFEAGMAFGSHPERTVIVEIGILRPVSDLAGRNVVRIGKTKGPLEALVTRLEAAGCPVDRSSGSWTDTARFADLRALRRLSQPRPVVAAGLPLGTRLASRSRERPAELRVRLLDRGRNDHLLEIQNCGGLALTNVSWELASPVSNWFILNTVPPDYPVAKMRPGDHLRVPVAITLGGSPYVELSLRATQPDGNEYATTERLSVYG